MQKKQQTKIGSAKKHHFLSIEKSADECSASILFKRNIGKTIEFQQALNQLLSQLNINEERVVSTLRDSLSQKVSETEKHRIHKFRIAAPHRKELQRILEMLISDDKIYFKIQGVPPELPGNGKILDIYFDHENYPGKVLPDGKIDFREINKFPAARAGENLMFVAYGTPGREGLTYSGEEISIPEPFEYPLVLEEGVERIGDHKTDSEGLVEGYFVKACRDGVVVLKKNHDQIVAVGVTDKIQLNQIDYAVGNIGTELHCPISMKIGIVKNGFKVKVKGQIEVQTLEGGIVETNHDAYFDQIQPNSEVFASGNIQTNSVLNSVLNSENGQITIKKEFRDSKLFASKIVINNNNGLYLNTEVETHQLNLENVLIGGKNDVYLGVSLFKERKVLLDKLRRIEQKKQKHEAGGVDIKNNLLKQLKKISSQIKDDNLTQKFKKLLETIQTLAFDDAFLILDDFKEGYRLNRVESAKLSFLSLQQHAQKGLAIEAEKQGYQHKLWEIEKKINEIRFTIKGIIKPTASITIFCDDEEPYVISSTTRENDQRIHISGRYHLEKGLMVQ